MTRSSGPPRPTDSAAWQFSDRIDIIISRCIQCCIVSSPVTAVTHTAFIVRLARRRSAILQSTYRGKVVSRVSTSYFFLQQDASVSWQRGRGQLRPPPLNLGLGTHKLFCRKFATVLTDDAAGAIAAQIPV